MIGRGDVVPLGEAAVRYARFRIRGANRSVQSLLSSQGGEPMLPPDRRAALVADAALRRLGVRCLGRAVVAAEMLRRRGVDARVVLSVERSDPRQAHADVVVDDVVLRPVPGDRVVLR